MQKIRFFIGIIFLTYATLIMPISWPEKGGPFDMTGGSSGQAGNSVAISSNGLTIAMGEPTWSDGTGPGRVRAYNLIDGSWVETGLSGDMTGENNGDQAGFSVAINTSGTMVAMGEPGWSGDTGRVRVYNLTGGSWTGIGGSGDMIGEGGDQAGFSVAISHDGSIVAIGEPGWPGATNTGRVRVYNFDGSSWTGIGGSGDMIGEGAGQAGYSVAINSDGNIVAIGEPSWSGDSGRVRVFYFDGSSWTALGGDQDMAGANASDGAGYSVAISSDGSIVAIGEPGWSNFRGRVRAYIFDDSSWVKTGGDRDMIGTNVSAQAGWDVALSSDGTIVAMGAPYGFDLKGGVQVYKLINGSWYPVGPAILGENNDDLAGLSVALDTLGTTVAMGEPYWIGGNQTGRVRAFAVTPTQQEVPFFSYKPQNIGGIFNVAGKIEDFKNTFYRNPVYPRLP